MRYLLMIGLSMGWAVAQAAEEAGHSAYHSAAHEHGRAQLNIVLEGQTLALALDSPAANLLGFEHRARTAEQKNRITQVQSQLYQPLQWLKLPLAAQCQLEHRQLEGAVFDTASAAVAEAESHMDIEAHYEFVCPHPEHLKRLDFAELLRLFPAIQALQVQLIGPLGQQGLELTPTHSSVSF